VCVGYKLGRPLPVCWACGWERQLWLWRRMSIVYRSRCWQNAMGEIKEGLTNLPHAT
jgi:hypothetical protein